MRVLAGLLEPQFEEALDRKEKGFIFTDKNLEDVTDEAGASLESIFADISVIIFDELSDDFEYMSSDEYVAECLEINDYDFDEDGNLL